MGVPQLSQMGMRSVLGGLVMASPARTRLGLGFCPPEPREGGGPMEEVVDPEGLQGLEAGEGGAGAGLGW